MLEAAHIGHSTETRQLSVAKREDSSRAHGDILAEHLRDSNQPASEYRRDRGFVKVLLSELRVFLSLAREIYFCDFTADFGACQGSLKF